VLLIGKGIKGDRYESSRPRRLSGFRLGHWEGCEAKVVGAVQAEHDSIGHLLESRCAAATSKVFEALRERACRSIEDVDVIEREDLAGLAAPLDSLLRVDAHDNSEARSGENRGSRYRLWVDPALARPWYSGLEGLAATVREYCRLSVTGI
jgi:hypothetical protein